jgi:hypothetical protein
MEPPPHYEALRRCAATAPPRVWREFEEKEKGKKYKSKKSEK